MKRMLISTPSQNCHFFMVRIVTCGIKLSLSKNYQSIASYNPCMAVLLNEAALDFELPDLQGNIRRLSDYRGRIVIVNFWSVECPHSERADGLILDLLEGWKGEVELLSVAANRNESARMVEEVSKTRGIPTVLIDAEHVVADRYEAVTTPHVFVIDREGILRYRGAVDNVTFRQRKATRFFLKDVVEALLDGHLPELTETPAYGCAIVREI
ncbi:MAG: redoxin domain-containing protein [Anaerolineae bacterium]|nr:redoxin domain-containing protein [Anaerolineae bacterium]